MPQPQPAQPQSSSSSQSAQIQPEGRRRVAIEGVRPQIDCGRFPIKRIAGDTVVVEANLFCDGHDQVNGRIVYWRETEKPRTVPLMPLGNDEWRGEFTVPSIGRYRYTVEGWVDPFETWRSDLLKRIDAKQEVGVDLLIGGDLVEAAARHAEASPANDEGAAADAGRLHEWARALRAKDQQAAKTAALDEELRRVARSYPDPDRISRFEKELVVVVDRTQARFSAWYEIFPRSCAREAGRYGTLRDCAARLPYVAAMGFDVVYLPPVHPIGRTNRKGKNNSVQAQPGDVGSPWAIGAAEGGHTALDPRLGTIDDFRWFVRQARDQGLEVALDIAFQCSPDHPYARSHPEWFRRRPDGTLQYAENPPKKYEDIYPFDFETESWQALWTELERIFLFWIEQGVRIFRVDNPHTKPFSFWEWALDDLKRRNPDVLFLAEAFTRPHVMYRLAKLGFSQSYTYFTWRTSKQELTDYFRELTAAPVRDFFRPNLWTNTPDILHAFLQNGGRPAFLIRLLLAATLGASYGIYGPAFELCENLPLQPGSEEYLNSEKYELRHWNLNSPVSLKDLIARINRIRRENPALQADWSLRFHDTDNPMLLCYSKTGSASPAGAPAATSRGNAPATNVIVVVVNLDPAHAQSGFVDLDLRALGLPGDVTFEARDLLAGGAFSWRGARNYVELTPGMLPGHILLLPQATGPVA